MNIQNNNSGKIHLNKAGVPLCGAGTKNGVATSTYKDTPSETTCLHCIKKQHQLTKYDTFQALVIEQKHITVNHRLREQRNRKRQERERLEVALAS